MAAQNLLVGILIGIEAELPIFVLLQMVDLRLAVILISGEELESAEIELDLELEFCWTAWRCCWMAVA